MPEPLSTERLAELRALAERREAAETVNAELIRTAVPELLDEIERLTRWRAEAMTVMDGLQDLGQALGLPLGERVTGPVALMEVLHLRADVARLERELDADAKHAALGEGEHCDVCTHLQAEDLLDDLERQMAERDALAAKTARVEALLTGHYGADEFGVFRRHLRAALAGEQ